jgi:exonuclease III
MRFGTWNVRSLLGSMPRTVAYELAKYELDLVAVQEVRWDKGRSEAAEVWIILDWVLKK